VCASTDNTKLPISRPLWRELRGLEPATSGVTGRSWRFRAERGSAETCGESRAFRPEVCGYCRASAGASGDLLRDQCGMSSCLCSNQSGVSAGFNSCLAPRPWIARSARSRKTTSSVLQQRAGLKQPPSAVAAEATTGFKRRWMFAVMSSTKAVTRLQPWLHEFGVRTPKRAGKRSHGTRRWRSPAREFNDPASADARSRYRQLSMEPLWNVMKKGLLAGDTLR
jgi:hypothetical protein